MIVVVVVAKKIVEEVMKVCLNNVIVNTLYKIHDQEGKLTNDS